MSWYWGKTNGRICSQRYFFLSSVRLPGEITGGSLARLTVTAVTFFLKILIGFSFGLQLVQTDNARCTGTKSEMLVFCDEWDAIKHLLEKGIPFSPFLAVQLRNVVGRRLLNHFSHLTEGVCIRLTVDFLYQPKMAIYKAMCMSNTHK